MRRLFFADYIFEGVPASGADILVRRVENLLSPGPALAHDNQLRLPNRLWRLTVFIRHNFYTDCKDLKQSKMHDLL